MSNLGVGVGHTYVQADNRGWTYVCPTPCFRLDFWKFFFSKFQYHLRNTYVQAGHMYVQVGHMYVQAGHTYVRSNNANTEW